MKRLLRPAARSLVSLTLALGLLPAHAQTPAAGPATDTPAPDTPPAQSALTSELFYELLLGELSVTTGDRAAGYALILDSAIKAKDPQLFQRAIAIALQSRSPDAALRAARAWRDALPDSREANRFLLQVLVAANRLQDSIEPLRSEIASSPPMERNAAILAVPHVYARAPDKQLALQVVEQALEPYTADKTTGASAWSSIGRMRQLAGDAAGALDAAARAQQIEPGALAPALLALELFGRSRPQAEEIVLRQLRASPSPEMQLAYARALLDEMRYAEATAQLEELTVRQPDFADGWLVLGMLQTQDGRTSQAEASLQRFLALAQALPDSEQRKRAVNQAYLALAQAAEKRKDYAGAEGWLNRIDGADELLAAQGRRASLLARQGRVDEARAMIRALPERNADEARMKLNAEVQLLRDAKRYRDAYDLLQAALERSPDDPDLLYEQAMMAERLGHLDEMERLLRRLIALRPDYHHAYNALGYSLADRNVRLDEAKRLIQKALEFVPNDPFIADSLGWVEFRLGNREEALRILERAFTAKPDAEIAAHFGEVLWAAGQRERALAIWREGLALSADNETLRATLKRLRIRGL
ncbi:tetratricopeptide repeat protein [Pseudorhodoferax sp.]|uniref:tetratricopeptide repeat protein n=1 Tax=Pseudorhodoferax sp. TaxID=1993553 RepID=UPI0039E694E9